MKQIGMYQHAHSNQIHSFTHHNVDVGWRKAGTQERDDVRVLETREHLKVG